LSSILETRPSPRPPWDGFPRPSGRCSGGPDRGRCGFL
jgi:hypothetical protein